MRHLLKLGLLSIMFLLLTGCSKQKGDKNKDFVESQPTPTMVVGEDNSKDGEKDNDDEVIEEPQGDSDDNIIIALDAGHGGGFVGASYTGRNEKDLTLKVTLYLKEYLEENYTGMEIHLVRERDTALSGDQKEDLELRAQFAQDVHADALVSLHFNASETHEYSGAMVFISNQENVTEACEKLGKSILKELEALGIENQGTSKRNSNDMFDANGKALDYYAINRHSAARDIPGIIVEHCFMDHPTDQVFIDSDEDLRALAKADAIGIAEFFGLSKK